MLHITPWNASQNRLCFGIDFNTKLGMAIYSLNEISKFNLNIYFTHQNIHTTLVRTLSHQAPSTYLFAERQHPARTLQRLKRKKHYLLLAEQV